MSKLDNLIVTILINRTGKSFIPVMMQIMEWGVGYIKETASCDMEICILSKFSCQKCYDIVKEGEIAFGK